MKGAHSPGQAYEYLLVFSKKGILKYISHLDLLRLFQRAIRRADLPVVFSQGFHPIPKIRFERALKLGIESDSERMYIKLKIPLMPLELKERLNAQLPPDIQVIQALRL
jgi:radical SAM-linked protein